MTREVADPRVGFATITSVETTPDLRHAKVWVSVIGQPAERDAAVAALQHAMPFIRHELGKTLRIKRIPDLHVQLDETAERGTRILHLLAELETGRDARGRRPGRGVAADAGRARPPGRRPRPRSRHRRSGRRRPRRGRAGRRRSGPRPTTPPQGAPPAVAMTRRPRAVPRRGPAAGRRAPARRPARARGQPREPRRRHARRDARRRAASSRRSAAAPTPVCTDPVPPLYDFLAGVERFRTDPDPDAPYDLLVISDCGVARAGRRGRRPPRRPVRAAAAGHHRPPRLERRDRRRRLDRPARRRDLRDGRRCSRPASASPLDAGDGALAAGADGRHRDGHRDVRPSERDAADAGRRRRRSSRPARRCPTSRAASTAPSPTPSCGCSGASSTGSRAPTTGGSSGRA